MSSPPKLLLLLLCAWALTGCASWRPPSTAPALPASLRQPCPPLPLPADGTGAAVLRTMLDWAALYRECADRHKALAEAAAS